MLLAADRQERRRSASQGKQLVRQPSCIPLEK